ncbi:hypothetical protein FB45DRAFT_1036615 [Roridomyces roridus]|uniref:Cyanovirin-N domain-containing protein n=1 Tax=Roridomyces roridus TaxID=1738132 RepID=A0AAD7FAY4_9AGAR|nr:hypothetical protein FB45DRAFT_1036615 [Roridomyces roridus]
MKYSLLSSILALAIGHAFADNCNVPLLYCGHSLLAKGNYQPQIDQCLFDNNHLTLDNGQSVLFGCIGGPNGVIQFLQDCGLNRCRDNGNGKNDTCF